MRTKSTTKIVPLCSRKVHFTYYWKELYCSPGAARHHELLTFQCLRCWKDTLTSNNSEPILKHATSLSSQVSILKSEKHLKYSSAMRNVSKNARSYWWHLGKKICNVKKSTVRCKLTLCFYKNNKHRKMTNINTVLLKFEDKVLSLNRWNNN